MDPSLRGRRIIREFNHEDKALSTSGVSDNQSALRPGAHFSKVPVTFRARNQIFSKLLHFVSLTDSFIMFDAKLLKPLSCM